MIETTGVPGASVVRGPSTTGAAATPAPFVPVARAQYAVFVASSTTGTAMPPGEANESGTFVTTEPAANEASVATWSVAPTDDAPAPSAVAETM